MSLENYSHEEISRMAMIELANEILHEEKKALDFREIFDRIAELKGYTEEEKKDALSRFYTDLNIDGRFMTLGSNVWGLKRWYPVEQIDEEIHAAPKKKKKSKKKKSYVEEKSIESDEENLDLIDDDIEELTGDFLDDEDDYEDYDDDLDEDLDEDEFDEDFEEDDDDK